MALTDAYVQVYGQLGDFFAKLQQGQAPDQFTRQHLVDLGFTSSNHRALIPLLKALGFLTPDGIPTPRYHEYRSKATGRRVMADALKESYRDLFVLKEQPTDDDRALIEGKFKSTHNTSERVAQLMANTFFALLPLADLQATPPTEKVVAETKQSGKPTNGKKKARIDTGDDERNSPGPSPQPTLHYNIQIHLPPTKDIEVFNAIFKSLKEHLFDE